jgi:hypothetical protein
LQSDYLDLSGRFQVPIKPAWALDSSYWTVGYHAAKRRFPQHTSGFLYYLPDSEIQSAYAIPAIAGQLRFRVTGSDDPASFDNGFDLCLNQGLGLVWGPRLVDMRKSDGSPNHVFASILIRDGFCKTEDLTNLPMFLTGLQKFLYFDQPFSLYYRGPFSGIRLRPVWCDGGGAWKQDQILDDSIVWDQGTEKTFSGKFSRITFLPDTFLYLYP